MAQSERIGGYPPSEELHLQHHTSGQLLPTHAVDGRRFSKPHPVHIAPFPEIIQIGREVERPDEKAELGEYIRYFDRAWQQEGLPQEWFVLKRKVGFSMQTQMNLLEHADDMTERAVWLAQTEQDIKGFTLEYLSDHLIYPCRYERDKKDPARLIDPKYGHKDIEDVVSAKERGGSVKESLGALKAYFLSPQTPDGAIRVMNSPSGPSGLTTDDGKEYAYPDSYFFIMQKNGDEVKNYTLKTDFSHRECRTALFELTGILLSPTAPIEDYVRAIGRIKPNANGTVRSVEDIIGVLANIRKDTGSTKAFKDVAWDDVYTDIANAEKLYSFNEDADRMLTDFRLYCQDEKLTKEDVQKGLAATILRISKLLLHDQKEEEQAVEVTMAENAWHSPKRPQGRQSSFGQVLTELGRRPGCAGGGEEGSRYAQSVVVRKAVLGEDEMGGLEFKCPECNFKNRRKPGRLLTHCKNPNCANPTKVACA